MTQPTPITNRHPCNKQLLTVVWKQIGHLQHGKVGMQSCCWFLEPHMSIYRRRGWLLSYFLEISQCGSQGIMMMAFDYVISPSAPNSSDHSTYYEGIHMWSGIIYGRVQTCFVLTRNISWLIFISSIFRRFYFPCISEALEMKNMIKWRRAHIPLVFIYTTATMFSTVDIVYSCSKSEHSVEFSSLCRGFGVHAWKMVL